MKKPNFLSYFIVLFIILNVSNLWSQTTYDNKFNINTVVIDAGHGGHDNGTSGLNFKEKDVALDIALSLGRKIEATYPSVRVIYTRTTDKFIPLKKRAMIANQNQADLFISIHCNGGSKVVSGTETFVLGLHRSEDNLKVAMRENNSILLENDYMQHYGSFDPSSPQAYILFNLIQSASLNQSLQVADYIEKAFTSSGRKSRGVKQAGFLVLRETTMPSVLIETGFLTNRNEENYLASSSGKEQISSSIFNAFQNYYKEIRAESERIQQEKAEQNRILEEERKRREESNWAWKSFRTIALSGDNYFVQLLVSKDYNKGKDIFPYDNMIISRIEVIDSYKYLLGPFKTKEEADRAHKQAQSDGFRDAYILLFRDGKIVR